MTFIHFNNSSLKVNPLIAALLVFIIGEAFVLTYFYSQTVNVRQDIREIEETVKILELQEMEFVNKRYAVLDTHALERTAAEAGLIEERRPTYLELPPEELATHP